MSVQQPDAPKGDEAAAAAVVTSEKATPEASSVAQTAPAQASPDAPPQQQQTSAQALPGAPQPQPTGTQPSPGSSRNGAACPGSNRRGWPQKGPVRALHPLQPQKWNKRHNLHLDSQNDPLPHNPAMHPSVRRGFSQPHSSAELEKYLSENRSPSARSLLLAFRTPEPKRPASVISADALGGVNARAPMVPERMGLGGTMYDRDKQPRPWNDRFIQSGSLANEFLHKSHRSYFAGTSAFEVSSSQRWRRTLEQEVSPSVWCPTDTRKPARFPPTGI
jgi:hypothetical protein